MNREAPRSVHETSWHEYEITNGESKRKFIGKDSPHVQVAGSDWSIVIEWLAFKLAKPNPNVLKVFKKVVKLSFAFHQYFVFLKKSDFSPVKQRQISQCSCN